MAQNKLQTERIDLIRSIRPMSCNMPGHEARMKANCERVQREYFDLKDKKGRFINNPQKESEKEFMRWYNRHKKTTVYSTK